MQITNLTANEYGLPGLRLHANETVTFDVARYTGDDRFRLEVNTLVANGKISVASAPIGFPIQTALEAEIARGEVPGAATPGGDSSVLTATKHITSAEILTLNSMPVVIVPGVANVVLVPLSVTIIYRFATVDYTSTNGYAINWEGFAAPHDPLGSTGDWFPICIDPGIDALYVPAPQANGPSGGLAFNDLPGLVGAGLILFVYNANPTGGDGTVDVTTTYLKVAA